MQVRCAVQLQYCINLSVNALPCRCCEQVRLLTLLEIEMHVHVHELQTESLGLGPRLRARAVSR
jgi:hypothetical protein